MSEIGGSKFLRLILHAIFLLSGITTVLIGQVLPILAERFRLNDLQLSYFFPGQFAGSILGTFLTSEFARRNRYREATMIGSILMAVGISMMNIDNFGACLAGFFINGLGIGITLPSINMLILEMSRARAAAALSLLNFCWGVGAIVCKPFVDQFSGSNDLGLTTYLLAVPLVLASLAMIPFLGNTDAAAGSTEPAPADDTPIWRSPIAWMIALFNSVHVGFESGMGGWLTTYTGRVAGEPLLSWLSPTLLFFGFFVLGRGVAPLLFRFLNENKMLLLGLLLILFGMAILLTSTTVAGLSVGATIAGFGTSWIFPTNVSRFSNTFGPTATRRATPLFVAGTLGAASSTWLIGFVSNQTGSLNSGMYVLLVSVLVLIGLQAILGTHKQRYEG